MSYVLMAWAVKQKTGSASRKAVLLALADRANKDTGRCDPSIARIAEDTELSAATVKRALGDLEESGLVERLRRKTEDGADRSTTYRFPHADATPVAHHEPPPGVTMSQGEGVTMSHEPVTTLNQEDEPVPLPASPGAVPQVDPSYDPVKGRKVDGQDLAWNALVAATEAVGDLNGARVQRALKDIRPILWQHVSARWPDAMVQAQAHPEGYERHVADAVSAVAEKLKREKPDLTWGPEGIARNFARTLADNPRSMASIVEEVRSGSAG
jgi:DNA-binding transcriptional ArsR family regulator